MQNKNNFKDKRFLSTLSLRRATLDTTKTADVRFLFLSTLSLRRATGIGSRIAERSKISIHALLAESDGAQRAELFPAGNFYPRSPCGERRQSEGEIVTLALISIHALLAESDRYMDDSYIINKSFLSTLSLRRATDF